MSTKKDTKDPLASSKKYIDEKSYEGLLSLWRNAPSGHPYFQGELGKYYAEVMAKKKTEVGDAEHVVHRRLKSKVVKIKRKNRPLMPHERDFIIRVFNERQDMLDKTSETCKNLILAINEKRKEESAERAKDHAVIKATGERRKVLVSDAEPAGPKPATELDLTDIC